MTANRIGFEPSRLTLGTVQLGLAYGIANTTGQPDRLGAKAILEAAFAAGITTLDTARAYGDSEAIIGSWLSSRARRKTATRIVTKLAPLPAGTADSRRTAALESLEHSRQAIGLEQLSVVLAHREADLLDDDIAALLESERLAGRIGCFGASVYSVEAAETLLALGRVAVLQVPLSAADRRFAESGLIARAAAAGVAVFARSIFLQGALLMAPDRLPPHLEPLAPALRVLGALAGEHGCPPSTLLMLADRDMPGVTSLVVGVERAEQLAPHIAAISAPPLPDSVRREMAGLFAGLPRAAIDPSQWPR